MKIKTKKISYEELNVVAFRQHKLPQRPSRLIKNLAVLLSRSELKNVHFRYEDNIKDKIKSKEPCLILMNHSSFIDLKIAETIFKKRDFQIVCTSDGFVGKEWLMRKVGCIPTQKFVTDIRLVKDFNAIYEVGDGRLTHDSNGFMLTGCNGSLNYRQSSKVSYSLYSDYFWYELGDMICIGDNKVLYYCFPKGENVIVAKARLAAEEIFKITRNDKMKA